MDDRDLEEYAAKGVQERVAWHTVAVDVSLASRDQPKWGTGSLVEIEGKLFLVSCKHLIRPEYRNEDLRVLYRSEVGFKWVDKEVIQKIDIPTVGGKVNKTFPREIPIKNRFYSDDKDDLVILEVDSGLKEEDNVQFFEFKHMDVKTPPVNTPVYLMGFSSELARTVTRYGNIGVFPFFGIHSIVDKQIESYEFDCERHFLIDFDATRYDINPFGLSGCGIWTRTPSGPNKLWTPNIYLVGIQHGVFPKSQVLVATRIERLTELVREMGKETR
jgi:hypothetical protein